MKRIIALAILSACTVGAPLSAQGPIGTLPRGLYVCELPGAANGAAGIEQPGENFRIVNASRYETGDGSGTYLRRGDRITMTSGPRSGASYQVISDGFLRKIDGGEPGRLRCVHSSR